MRLQQCSIYTVKEHELSNLQNYLQRSHLALILPDTQIDLFSVTTQKHSEKPSEPLAACRVVEARGEGRGVIWTREPFMESPSRHTHAHTWGGREKKPHNHILQWFDAHIKTHTTHMILGHTISPHCKKPPNISPYKKCVFYTLREHRLQCSRDLS